MRTRSKTGVVGALVLSLSLLVAGPALAITSIELGDQATMVSKGAGLYVPVEITCDPGTEVAFADVQVAQRRGNEVANGWGSVNEPIVCDGQPHTYQILVRGDRAFKRGEALATATLAQCDPFFSCQTFSDTEVILITR